MVAVGLQLGRRSGAVVAPVGAPTGITGSPVDKARVGGFETVGTLPDGETLRAGVPCVVSQSGDSAFEVLLRKNLRSREPLQSSTMYRLPTTAALAQQNFGCTPGDRVGVDRGSGSSETVRTY